MTSISEKSQEFSSSGSKQQLYDKTNDKDLNVVPMQICIDDSSQQICDRDASSQKKCDGLKQINVVQGNINSTDDAGIDFSVTERGNRTHFINTCFETPSVYSCAVDCFLELSFRLFTRYLCNISEDQNQGNAIFNMVMNALPVYETAALNSDVVLLSQIREPIWECIISSCPSFIARNCDAEFSQIFTGAIFNDLSSQEKLYFESSYSVAGTCLHCSSSNERNFRVSLSYISEIDFASYHDVSNWPQMLNPNSTDDTVIRCVNCGNQIFNALLTNFQASRFRFIEFSPALISRCRFQSEILIQNHRYELKAVVRHVGAHFTCCIANCENNWLFLDDMNRSTLVFSNLEEIFEVYTEGWFFGIYVEATNNIETLVQPPSTHADLRTPININGNFQVRKRKFEVVKDYSLRSKEKNTYYEKNKYDIKKGQKVYK